MKEVLITRGMLYDGTVKVGDKVTRRYHNEVSKGVVTELTINVGNRMNYFTVVWEVGEPTQFCMENFHESWSIENCSACRVYLVASDNDTRPAVAPELYVVLDGNKVVLYDVPWEAVEAHALLEMQRVATLQHLSVVPKSGLKKVEVKVGMK